ncbi:RNA polymerase sigma factor [Piscinibacter sp. XHJ-5]|uniref:RNA polymerase sigma factor n=1 Tax=Piscinibacter sp. XHJ-5 TaxID=3037797 RepID=UPI002452ACFA|nr:RNA polymerase sigma factor [Piscinibacter sp. XHJ-5]
MNDHEALPLIEAAVAGSERALEQLIAGIQHQVYRLSLRMLGSPADAQDASQEILIRIVTSLASFERRSTFATWVHSIAANHLRDAAERRDRRAMASLDAMAERLDAGLAATAHADIGSHRDDPALRHEARELGLRCTQGMLMGLDVDQRLALVLSEIFGVDTAHGARVLGISPAAYRQRLSRGRRRLHDFLQGRCGLVDENARCSCTRQALACRAAGHPVKIRNMSRSEPEPALDEGYRELSLMHRIAAVLRRTPEWKMPEEVTRRLRHVIAASPMLGHGDTSASGVP